MAIATKKLLADGLKELLGKKTLDKITVKELVTACGVNRQTFYYNFQDIYELLEEILTEYIQDVDISEENREFMIRMYDLFWVDLVMRWIQSGMEISEMTGDIEKIMYVMTGSSQYIAQSLKAFENKDRKALRPAGEKNKKN